MCHLLLSQISQETQDKLKIAKPSGKTCGTCDFFETDDAFNIHGICSRKHTDVSRYQRCSLGDNLNSIEIAMIATALLVITKAVWKYAATKYENEIDSVKASVITLEGDKTVTLEAINEIKTLLENCQAVSEDGKITTEEMEKIYAEVIGIVNSPAVSKLLTNFGS